MLTMMTVWSHTVRYFCPGAGRTRSYGDQSRFGQSSTLQQLVFVYQAVRPLIRFGSVTSTTPQSENGRQTQRLWSDLEYMPELIDLPIQDTDCGREDWSR